MKWIKDKYNSGIVWKMIIILFIIFLPLILITFYTHAMNEISKYVPFMSIWSTGSTDGWLGLIGAYFGAIIAIGGVYWQVRAQSKADRKNSFDSAVAFERYKEFLNIAGEFYDYSSKTKEYLNIINRCLKDNVNDKNPNELINDISKDEYTNFDKFRNYFGKFILMKDSKNNDVIKSIMEKYTNLDTELINYFKQFVSEARNHDMRFDYKKEYENLKPLLEKRVTILKEMSEEIYKTAKNQLNKMSLQ